MLRDKAAKDMGITKRRTGRKGRPERVAAFGADPGEGAVCPLALPREYFHKEKGLDVISSFL
jgi:hypothetical protein